jgi:O-antigen/teichoic acid export membrane protein
MFDTDLRHKVLSGLRWSAGLRFFGQLITWIITIIVMRLLSPKDYGLMGMAGMFIAFLAMVNEIGLGAALIQRRDMDEGMVRQIFGILLIINFGLFFISLFVAPLLAAAFFKEQRLVPLIRLMSVQFIMASFVIIPQSIIDREMLFREKSIIELVSAVSGSLMTLLFALNGWGVWSLVWGSITISLCRTVGFNLIRPYLHLPLFSFKRIGREISFGGYVAITRMLWSLYSQADILIIGRLLGKQLLGFYSVAFTLASLPMQKVSGIINQVAFPAFASVQTDIEKVTSHFLKAVRIMGLVAFPVFFGISSIAPDLVDIVLGEKWSLAIVPLQVLSLVIPIRMISNLISPTLLGLGRADVNFWNAVTASLMLPLGFLIGCYWWDIIGVSLAWVTIFPIIFLINLSRMLRTLKIGLLEVMAALRRPIVAAVIMYISVTMIKIILPGFEPITRLSLSIIGGALVYVGMVLTLDRKGYYEVLDLIHIRS